jgi:hypothetical protein
VVLTPLKAQPPRSVVDRDHVGERPLESSDNGGTIAGAVETLAVVVTISPVVQILCNHVHRLVHLEIKLACVRRQLLIAQPTVAPVVQAWHARCSGNVLRCSAPRIRRNVFADGGVVVQHFAKEAVGAREAGERRHRKLHRLALQHLGQNLH